MSAGTTLVRARDLSVLLGGRAVLREADVAVRRGDFVGVIGPNGAGKSTLLRALVGLIGPAAGTIELFGRPLDRIGHRERARMVSYLGQEPPEAQPFPVLDVVLLGRYAHHGRFARETSADRERAHRSLEYVGLSGFEHRPYTELSGGERQLVLFARILAQETDLLLLDEPTANLDIRHQDLFFSMLWELAREGKGALVSVHNLNVASQYCSRLVLLDKGRVVAEGRAEDVLRPDLLDPVYGAATVVSPSPGTGSLTVAVLPRGPKNGAGGRRIHLIGGAGSAVNPTRALARLGYDLSAGIAHEYDADEALWRNLGVPRKTVGAFSRIHAEDVRAAQTYVESAELVILCSFPVGPGNLENLRLAARARRLVIVVPGPGDLERSFFSQEARDLFEALPPHALRVSYRELVADLESGRFWEESTPEA